MEKKKIGYTQGVFDMFHIGHLNLLIQAKKNCDYLIVGVNSDRLVQEYKNKTPVINEKDRVKILSSIKYVDECVVVDTLDKLQQWNNYTFDEIYIGSDWKGNERWKKTEEELEKVGSKVVYLEYTEGVSSTFLRDKESVKEGEGK